MNIRTVVRKARNAAGAFFLGMALSAGFTLPASAAVTVTVSEVGADVQASATGSANLTGLTFNTTAPVSPQISGQDATVITGAASANASLYFGLSGPTQFGTGSPMYFPNAGAGQLVGVTCLLGPNCLLYVPVGYVSGAPLAGSSTYAGRTLASVGLAPGVYTYTWASDSLTVVIGLPNAPVVTASAGPGAVTLNWNLPAANGPAITGYLVRYRTAGGAWNTWPTAGLATTTTVTGLVNGTSYEFTVAAVNPRGTGDAGRALAMPFRLPTLAYPSPVTVYTTAPAVITPATSDTIGAVTFSNIGPLPAGLALAPATGVITGTATAAPGTYPVTVQLSQAAPAALASATFNIVVVGTAPNPSIVYPDYTGTSGVFVSLAPTVTGVVPAGYALAPGSNPLPTGLSLAPATGIISGTPTRAASNLNVDVTVSGAGGPATNVVLFTINPTLHYVPANGTAGVPLSIAPVVSDLGGLPATFAIAGALPAGLSFNAATGAVTGTPATPGNAVVTITMTVASPGGNLVVPADLNIGIALDIAGIGIPVNSPIALLVLAAALLTLGLRQWRAPRDGPR